VQAGISRTGIKNRRQVAQPAFMDGVQGHAVRVHEHEPYIQAVNRLPRRLRMFGIAEQSRSAAILQQLGQLVGVQSSVERDDRASRRNGPEIRGHPARMVVRHNGQARSARESVFCEPSSNRFRHAVEFGVGATFDAIVALDFQCDVIRPALGALDKTVVESGHESCGIYTKNLFTAVCAGLPRTRRSILSGSFVRSAFSS